MQTETCIMTICTKFCNSCKETKDINDFHLNSLLKDGHSFYCKQCMKEYRHAYYQKNIEKTNILASKWRQNNYEHAKECARKWNKQHPDKIKKYVKKHKSRSPESYKQYCKTWIDKNKEKRRETCLRGQRKRRTIPKYIIAKRISCHIRMCLCGNKNTKSWESLVGYTKDKLKKHIEKKFLKGMSWDNTSLWHIDHIIPISAFNFEIPEDIDFKRCFALKNLRPLWAKDNMIKNDKLEAPFQPSLLL